MSPRSERLAVGMALGSVVALALVLRRWGWESWSFWLDECLQLLVANQSPREIITLLRIERNHPPVDFLLTHAALKISASALFLRWIPTAFSVAALPLVFARAGGFRRPLPALGAAAALATFPLAVHQGQELRAYALSFFLVALADVARAKHAETGRRGALALQALSSVGAVYSLYFAFFPLAIFWAFDLLESLPPGRALTAHAEEPERRARARLRVMSVPAITILAFLPWLLAVRSTLTRPNELPAPPMTLRLVAELATGFAADRQPELRFAAAGAAVWILAGLGLAAARRGEGTRAALEVAGIAIGVGLFLKVTNHWFELRYFWFAFWPLARLVGEGLAAAAALAGRRRVPAFAASLVLLLAVQARGLAENARFGRVDWRRPVGYLAFQRAAGRAGPVFPVDGWSYTLLYGHHLESGDARAIPQPCAERGQLFAALGTVREGWFVKAKGGNTESGRFLESESKPWAVFERADGAKVYRFENGHVVPP